MKKYIPNALPRISPRYNESNIITFISILDILFSSNDNIHKSSCDHCFWASDPLIEGF